MMPLITAAAANGSQAITDRIAVGGPIVNEAIRQTRADRLLEQRLDERHFAGTSAVDVDGERQSGAVNQEHELRALAALGRAVVFAPFLAAANVPSAKPSSLDVTLSIELQDQPSPRAIPDAVVRPLLEPPPASAGAHS